MKNLKSLVLATALFLGATSLISAQSKVAHINKQELVKAMPEYKTAQADIEKLGKSYETDIQASAKELQDKMKLYDAQAASQTDTENQKRVQEVETMRQSIIQYQSQAQQDMQQKEVTLLKPIVEKADAAIKKVAKSQGFQYVLDSAMLIMADGKDLMTDVRKELGI